MDIRVDRGKKDADIQVFWGVNNFYVDREGSLRVLTTSEPEVAAAIFRDWSMVRLVSDEERAQYLKDIKASL